MRHIATAAAAVFGLAPLAVAILVLGGCASIINGATQKIAISARPESAQVRIIDEFNREVWSSSSPGTAVLKRGDGYFKGAAYRVEVSKDGYEKKTVTLTASIDGGWYFVGNFFLGGLIGWLLVDPMTGGMYTLSPDSVNAELMKKAALGPHGPGELVVVLTASLPRAVLQELDLRELN
jgi:hypothetical protein